MPSFRVKAIRVEAEPYRPGLEDGWAHCWPEGALTGRFASRREAEASAAGQGPGFHGQPVPVLRTSTGVQQIREGDWIVTAETGERSLLPPERFGSAYEPADSAGAARR